MDYTPGPWEVVQTTRGGPLIARADKKDVIECPGSGGAMSYSDTIAQMHWTGTPEWEANARLIAAAPNLLLALSNLLHARSPETVKAARAALQAAAPNSPG